VCVKKQARVNPQIKVGQNRVLNGRKTENSPIGNEALTKAKMSDRYDDTQKRNRHGFSSTRQGTALPVSEGPDSRKGKEVAAS
jgi:hypothetical protein